MTLEQLTMCALPHTTSKIQAYEDITEIVSYGFRGEALARWVETNNSCVPLKTVTTSFQLSLICFFFCVRFVEDWKPASRKTDFPMNKKTLAHKNSLASVTEELEIISRHKQQDLAYLMKFDHDGNPREDSISTQAMTHGTKVTVKNLFKMLPVRLKVCKQDKTVNKRLIHVTHQFS